MLWSILACRMVLNSFCFVRVRHECCSITMVFQYFFMGRVSVRKNRPLVWLWINYWVICLAPHGLAISRWSDPTALNTLPQATSLNAPEIFVSSKAFQLEWGLKTHQPPTTHTSTYHVHCLILRNWSLLLGGRSLYSRSKPTEVVTTTPTRRRRWLRHSFKSMDD